MDLSGNRPMLMGCVCAAALVGVLAARGPSDGPLLQRTAPAEGPTLLRSGDRAPDLRLATVHADSVRLEDLRGGQSVLVFVTPTCPYCRELKTEVLERELPELDGRLVFVTSSVVDSNAPAGILDVETRVGALYPVAVDTGRVAFEAYRAQSVPTVYLVDAEGRVSDSSVGAPDGLALIDRFVRNRSRAQRTALEGRL